MAKTTIIFVIAIIIIIGAVITVIINARLRPIEKEFNGYILWLREAVVFTNRIQIDGAAFEMRAPIVWVEENEVVNSVYDTAFTLTTGTSPYDDDDIKIIKVTFRGLYYDKDNLYWRNGPYEARTKVRVTDIISYSNIIEN